MYWNARIKRLGYQFRQKMSFSRGIFHSRQKRRKGKGTELRLIFDNSKHKRRFLCPQRGNTGEGEVTVQVRKLFIFRHRVLLLLFWLAKTTHYQQCWFTALEIFLSIHNSSWKKPRRLMFWNDDDKLPTAHGSL